MTPPNPPWYQFLLRSLLLLMLNVAVLCSIGVCTHSSEWPVLGSTMLIGGVTGRIISGSRWGFVTGAVFGLACFSFTLVGCFTLLFAFPQALDIWREVTIILVIAALIGGVLGGIVGGFFIRFLGRLRSRRRSKL